MIGTTLGPYPLDAELGSGGMGTVWRATGADGVVVAIKVVHPHLLASRGFRERFEREANLGLAIWHPNLDADEPAPPPRDRRRGAGGGVVATSARP